MKNDMPMVISNENRTPAMLSLQVLDTEAAWPVNGR